MQARVSPKRITARNIDRLFPGERRRRGVSRKTLYLTLGSGRGARYFCLSLGLGTRNEQLALGRRFSASALKELGPPSEFRVNVHEIVGDSRKETGFIEPYHRRIDDSLRGTGLMDKAHDFLEGGYRKKHGRGYVLRDGAFHKSALQFLLRRGYAPRMGQIRWIFEQHGRTDLSNRIRDGWRPDSEELRRLLKGINMPESLGASEGVHFEKRL